LASICNATFHQGISPQVSFGRNRYSDLVFIFNFKAPIKIYGRKSSWPVQLCGPTWISDCCKIFHKSGWEWFCWKKRNEFKLQVVWRKFFFLINLSSLLVSLLHSDGFGSKIFDLGRVGSIYCGSGWVGSGQPYKVWVWIWKISPRNVKFFIFFTFGSKKFHWVGWKSTRIKGGLVSYLLQVKSKLGSGQGPSLLLQIHLKKCSTSFTFLAYSFQDRLPPDLSFPHVFSAGILIPPTSQYCWLLIFIDFIHDLSC